MPEIRAALQQALEPTHTLERELTGGGMATVFVARENALNRQVVIKVLPPELAAEVSVERFRREILMSAALQHPHIVPVISAGEVGGLPYFIMPFIDGESLRTRLTRGPLAVRETVGVLKDVSRALIYAHGRDVVHRDIKPDNILITGGSAVVTDFGVAKAISASSRSARGGRQITPGGSPAAITAHGIAIGTPAYMAPEQAAGDPATDHRADLYALGIVAWEMLAGTAPFHGISPQQVMASQLTARPAPIGSRRYDVPKALAAIVDQLLAKEPKDRPKSAADVVRMLDNPAVVSGNFAAAPRNRVQQAKRAGVVAMLIAAIAAVLYFVLRGKR
ncbi:MAG TPA: serine/threonine-protein kinase [Gemmatimonadales bacterium]